MKITQNQSGQLVAKEDNILAYLLGAGLIVVGCLILSLVSIVLILIGLIIIVLKKKVTIVLDKSLQTVEYKAGNLISKETKTINFSDIQKLQLISQEMHHSGEHSHNKTYLVGDLRLVLKDQQVIRLTTSSQSVAMFKKASDTSIPNSELGKQIADYIGVVLETDGPGAVQVSQPPNN